MKLSSLRELVFQWPIQKKKYLPTQKIVFKTSYCAKVETDNKTKLIIKINIFYLITNVLWHSSKQSYEKNAFEFKTQFFKAI